MKIRFKSASKLDFTKLYPIISEEDYALLEGQHLVLTNNDYKKLKKDGYLDLNGLHIPSDTIIIDEVTLSEAQEKVLEAVEEKFIYSNDVVDVLMTGLETGKNVLLWGKGGHGKSEITELVFKTLYKEGIIKEMPFVQAFGDGLTEEKLFGGMNIKKYREEGLIEYLPEYSFMNHEIVVFEEIFDAPASVLLSLKDIMTSKKFRQGNEVFNIKTKIIIGLTNRSKDEFGKDNDSLKALSERFNLTLKVEWNSYSKANFVKLFKKVLGDDIYEDNATKLSTLADIINMNNTDGGTFVSPRTAVAAADIYIKGRNLKFISEIDPEILEKYHQKAREEELVPLHTKLIADIDKYIDANDLEIIDESEEFLKELNEVEIETGGEPLDINKIARPTAEIKLQKLNKARYLLSIIDRTTPVARMNNNFTDLKKRLNNMISSLNNLEVREELEDNVNTEQKHV